MQLPSVGPGVVSSGPQRGLRWFCVYSTPVRGLIAWNSSKMSDRVHIVVRPVASKTVGSFASDIGDFQRHRVCDLVLHGYVPGVDCR